MESMNFDNIYLLLVGIPLLAVVLVPYFWAIRKSNRTKSVVVSLVLHLAMVIFVTFALSGMSITTVMTKTEVVVLADVSYSATRNESEIDKSVMAIKNALPQNSDMSVVAFGRDYKVITKTDEKFTTVKNSGVDDSATNIAGALRYVENMFSDETIKRVVIVTDGKQTDGANGDVITAVSALMDKNIKVDAIYLDSNITEKDLEVQISDATYNHSTYLGHKAQVQVMVQSSQENVQSILRLYNGGKEIDSQAETLAKGYNIFTFALPTTEAGVHNYDVVIETADDETVQNNKYSFLCGAKFKN